MNAVATIPEDETHFFFPLRCFPRSTILCSTS